MNVRTALHAVASLSLLACASPPPPAPEGPPWDITRPRGTPREVDFVTREGTWMSVDVSPDGKSLVFDLLAHVYRVPIEGGRADCLTQPSGIATNFQPRWSPDGRRIAFVSDRAGQNNLWVMEADGGNPRIVHPDLVSRHAEPSWAPDGRSLYATRFFPNTRGGWTKTAEIWRFPLDGAPPEKLLGTPDTQVWSASPSADGRYLYYHQASAPIVSADGFYKISDQHHLRRLDLERGHGEAVTAAESRSYYRRLPFYEVAPRVSPDGRSLAFVRNVPGGSLQAAGGTFAQQAGLWIRDLETGRERLLMHPVTPTQVEIHSMFHQDFVPGYAWAPDGRSIALSQGGKLRRVSLVDGAVSTVPIEARVRRTISEQNRPSARIDLEPFEVRVPRWPALSPDGKTLLFEAVGSIWRKEFPGGAPARLVEGDPETFELSPAWSADGREIAFATWNDAEGGHVWKVAAGGGKPVRLTARAGEYLNPAWSPDGRSVVAVKGAGASFRGLSMSDNGWFDLVRIPAGGGEDALVHRMRPQQGETQFTRPFFGPGGRIYFTEQGASGRNALASVGPDGSGRREHASFALSEDVQLSPDGSRVAFHAAHNVFVAPFSEGRHYDHDGGGDVRRAWGATGRYPVWGRDGRLRFLSACRLMDDGEPVELGLKVPSDFARGSVALVGARIITSDEAGVLERGTVVVRDGRIAAVGNVEPGGVDRVIDATGKTIIPGLVDGHAHNQASAPDLLRPRNWQSAKYLAYGVTTAHDPAARANVTFQLAELTRAGRVLGPRLYAAGVPLRSWGENRHEIRTYEDAAENVERLASEGARSIKQYFQINRFQRQWIAEACRRTGGLLLTGEGMDVQYDLGTIMDGQNANEHPVMQLPYYGDLLEFFRQTGTHFSPTLVTPGGGHMLLEYFMSRTDLPRDARELNFTNWRTAFRQKFEVRIPLEEYQASLVIAGVKAFRERGVLVALGGHGEVPGASSHFDLWLHALGLPPLECLKIGTIETARYLGLDRDVGSIKAGKLADLVVLNSNPLEDIRNSADIQYVMKGGRLYESATLDQVWPEKKPFGPRPWKDDAVLNAGGVRGDDHHDRR